MVAYIPAASPANGDARLLSPVYKHIPRSSYEWELGHNDRYHSEWIGTHNHWNPWVFEEIAFTLDVLADENLHQIGHAVRLKSKNYPNMYVVMVGGEEDNRGFDPYDSTIHEGSYLTFYSRNTVERHGDQTVTETTIRVRAYRLPIPLLAI